MRWSQPFGFFVAHVVYSLPKDTSSANCSAGAPCYQTSLALGTLTSGLPYDVFAYSNAGVPTLELLAWTSGTARATSVILQDGVYVKSGATTRRYLGTFYTTATTTEDSALNRFVWNAQNRVSRKLYRTESTASWTYTSTTCRSANANSANKVQLVVGLAIDRLSLMVNVFGQANAVADGGKAGIGRNSTSINSADTWAAPYSGSISAVGGPAVATLAEIPAVGYSYYAWLEGCTNASCVFYAANSIISTGGITGEIFN